MLSLSLIVACLSSHGTVSVFAEDSTITTELENIVAGDVLIAEDFSTVEIGQKPQDWILHQGGWVWNGDKGTATVAYDSNNEKKLNITSPGGTAALVLPSYGKGNYEITVKVHLDKITGTIGLLTNIKDPVSDSNKWKVGVTHSLLDLSASKVTLKDREMTTDPNKTEYTEGIPTFEEGADVKLTAKCYNGTTYFYIDDVYIAKITSTYPELEKSLCGFYACGATVSLNYVTVSELVEGSQDGSNSYNPDDIRNSIIASETLIDEDLTTATQVPSGWELNKTSRVWNSANSSMSITTGGLEVKNTSGDLELNLPSINTSNYAITVNLIPKSNGNIGLLTNVKDPYTSATYVTRTFVKANADNSTETVNFVNKGGSNNEESKPLTDVISGGINTNQSVKLSAYSYNGITYFYVNDAFAGKFAQYNPDLEKSLCGIYLCGTTVVVTSVKVESIEKGDAANIMYATENILDEDFSDEEVGTLPEDWKIFEGKWASGANKEKTIKVGQRANNGQKYLGVTAWQGTAAVLVPFNRTSDYVMTVSITPQTNNGIIGLLTNIQYPHTKSKGATHSLLYLKSKTDTDQRIYQYNRIGDNGYDKQYFSDIELLGKSYGQSDTVELSVYSYKGVTSFYIDGKFVSEINQRTPELEYSYCGIYGYGTSFLINSVKVDKIEPKGSTSALNVLGAQVRYAGVTGETGDTAASGIRFVSQLDKNSYIYKNNFDTTYSYDDNANAQIGTLILPSSNLKIGEKLTVDTEGCIDIPLTTEYEQTEDKLTFSATILGGDEFDEYYATRSYIKIGNEYYYSNQIERSKSRLATRCYADDKTTEETKNKLDTLFASSTGYVTGNNVKTLDFTVIGDFHYKQGMYYSSVADLETILGRANDNNSNFVLHLGDFSNDYRGSKELTDTWMNSNLPTYGIYGNHELESAMNSMKDVTPMMTNQADSVVWGTADGKIGDGSIAYYYFESNGFRVVCTDSNYSWNPTYKVWEHNKTNSYGGPNGNQNYNSLGDKQLVWLENVLTDAAQKDIPCIVVSHATYSGSWEPSPDSEKVQAIFKKVNNIKKGTVTLALNGHNHKDHIKVLDGVVYLDVNTTRNTWWNDAETTHYTDDQTFEYIKYNADGTVASKETASLNVLSGSEKTYYSADAVSANIKISTAGYIIVDGYQSSWLYDLDPEVDSVTGVTPQIVDRTIDYLY